MEHITYEMLKNTAPRGMKKHREPGKLTLWNVLIFFAAVMILFFFAGSYVQYHLGMSGVMITELMFLVLSVGFVLLRRADPRTVFPVQKPRMILIGAAAVLWLASWLAMLIVNLILAYFFPAGVLGAGSSTNAVISSIPWGPAFLVTAVLPAVCEEALHRGVIQCGVQNTIRKPWLIVLVMGLFFGFFHVSLWKFIPTAMLGAAMSYLLLRTGNMVYSSFFHFLHNGVQMLLLLPAFTAGTGMTGSAAAPGTEIPMYRYVRTMLPVSLGIYLCIGAAIPFLVYLALWMMQRAEVRGKIPFLPQGREKKTLFAILFPTCLLFVLGISVFYSSFSAVLRYGL